MHQTNNDGICTHCNKNPKEMKEISHQLRPFTILQGKYLVGDVLGEGGFGITYIGLELNLEIPVAIKEFYPNGFVTRESAVTTGVTVYSSVDKDVVKKWKDNFLEEARSLAKCSNLPGVVGVKDFFHENNTVYIVQEYLDGQDLKSYIKARGGKIPASELIKLMEPVIVALNEVHKKGLIHRDISPDNIRLLENGIMKVMDFGAARSFAEENEKSKSVLLKPGYAPEEQYRTRGNQGTWTDVYALCATMYKCITGVTPIEAMERLRRDEMKWPSEMGVPVPKNFENILKKGMAVLAEDRIQTMQELYDAIYHGNVVIESTGTAAEKVIESVTSAITGAVTGGINNGNTEDKKTGYKTGYKTGVNVSQSVNDTQNQNGVKITKPALMIAAGSFLCICLIAVALLTGGNKNKKVLQVTTTTETTTETTTADSVEKAEENVKTETVSTKASSADIKRMQELKNIAQEMEDVTTANELMSEVAEIFSANEGDEEIQTLSYFVS